MTAGSATRMPTAVAMSASEIEAMTLFMPAEAPPALPVVAPSSLKAVTMPSTVPKRPMKGALLPSVPRKTRPPSNFFRRARTALATICSTASGPWSYQVIASPMIGLDRGVLLQQLARGRQVVRAQRLAEAVRQLGDVGLA